MVEKMGRILEDRVAIVTGAAQGLGEAICLRLAKEGAHVIVADINLEGARNVASLIQSDYNRTSHAIQVDVTNETQVEAMTAASMNAFGKLDILVSNAGILISGSLDEFPVQKWRTVIDVNLLGYFLCAKYAARIMVKQNKGSIIQINSKSGKKGSYKNSAYAASKFAGIGLTQSLALELAEHNVRVNAVCPGNLLDSPLWIDSLYKQYAQNQGLSEEQIRQKYISQVPLGRGCTYEDVNNIVVFLASDQSSYMTGQAINVTGGQEMR
jgi:sorbitol-6-phosphate 2-dehydrogenase